MQLALSNQERELISSIVEERIEYYPGIIRRYERIGDDNNVNFFKNAFNEASQVLAALKANSLDETHIPLIENLINTCQIAANSVLNSYIEHWEQSKAKYDQEIKILKGIGHKSP